MYNESRTSPPFSNQILGVLLYYTDSEPLYCMMTQKIRPLNRLLKKVDSRAIDNRPFEYTRKLEQRMPKMIRVFAFPVSNSYYFKIIMDNIAPCTCNRFILVLYICIHSILFLIYMSVYYISLLLSIIILTDY